MSMGMRSGYFVVHSTGLPCTDIIFLCHCVLYCEVSDGFTAVLMKIECQVKCLHLQVQAVLGL